MSDRTISAAGHRAPPRVSSHDAANPLGLDGIGFVEYATDKPGALGLVLETMGFERVGRHRSRGMLLFRHGELHVVLNAHPVDTRGQGHGGEAPFISAMGLRVHDGRSAYLHVLEHGAWSVPAHAEMMDLDAPAIHGVGGSRICFLDPQAEQAFLNLDFLPEAAAVAPSPPAIADLRLLGLVQHIGPHRRGDWIQFYSELLGAQPVHGDGRVVLEVPTRRPGRRFSLYVQELQAPGETPSEECLKHLVLGVADLEAAVRLLRERGVAFSERGNRHGDRRSAFTRTWLGSVVFELVQA